MLVVWNFRSQPWEIAFAKNNGKKWIVRPRKKWKIKKQSVIFWGEVQKY